MEGREQARAYADADFEAPHSGFIAAFLEAFPGVELSGAVLDLGCGPGDVTIRFARQFPGCCVYGLDGSEAMLHEGARLLAGAPEVAGRVKLIAGLLPGPNLPRQKYHALISNSLLHHLRDPQALWAAVRLYAEKRAPVFIMDLMRPASRVQAAMMMEKYMAGEPDILKEDFFNSLLAAYEPDEVRAQLAAAGLSDFTVQPASDRHLLVWGNAPGN